MQFCAPMHHHVAVNSPIAGRNLLLKNAYGKPLPACLSPHKIEPITPTLVLENFVERETRPFIARAMRDIARTHARASTTIMHGDAIRYTQYANRNFSRGKIAFRPARARARLIVFIRPYFPTGSILSTNIICKLILQACVSAYCDVRPEVSAIIEITRPTLSKLNGHKLVDLLCSAGRALIRL